MTRRKLDTNFQAITGTSLGVRTGGRAGPTQIQSTDEVAGQIASLIENPVAELYTNPSSPALVQQYFRDVGQFEENMVRRTSSN